jgi:hypothetical protein
MGVWCNGRGGFARGRRHEFEPHRSRSVTTLREKNDGDGGWSVGSSP